MSGLEQCRYEPANEDRASAGHVHEVEFASMPFERCITSVWPPVTDSTALAA
jgi:hypothetical protein